MFSPCSQHGSSIVCLSCSAKLALTNAITNNRSYQTVVPRNVCMTIPRSRVAFTFDVFLSSILGVCIIFYEIMVCTKGKRHQYLSVLTRKLRNMPRSLKSRPYTVYLISNFLFYYETTYEDILKHRQLLNNTMYSNTSTTKG